MTNDTKKCACGEPTCVEPWEPGCGLGLPPEYLTVVQPVSVRQAWYEEEIASAESHWTNTFQERFEDGDDVPDKRHFVALWLAERTPPSNTPKEPVGFDEWFDEYTKNNYTDEMLALAAWRRALAQQPETRYADADALIAHLDSLCDESDEKWDVAQAAIAGIRAAQQPAAVEQKVHELRLCEASQLHLFPGRLYQFTVDPICKACMEALSHCDFAQQPAAVAQPVAYSRVPVDGRLHPITPTEYAALRKAGGGEEFRPLVYGDTTPPSAPVGAAEDMVLDALHPPSSGGEFRFTPSESDRNRCYNCGLRLADHVLDDDGARCKREAVRQLREITAPPSAPVEVAGSALIDLIEGAGCARWQNEQGFRLKDTPEWVAFYNATKRALSQQPAAVDEFAEDRNRLLRAFMQECGVIGPEKAGVNLARGIKAALAARKGEET